MKRWISFLGHLVIIVVLTSFGINKDVKEKVVLSQASLVKENALVAFPSLDSRDYEGNYETVFLKKEFLGFKEAIAFKESQGNYSA